MQEPCGGTAPQAAGHPDPLRYGYPIWGRDRSGFAQALEAVRQADVVIRPCNRGKLPLLEAPETPGRDWRTPWQFTLERIDVPAPVSRSHHHPRLEGLSNEELRKSVYDDEGHLFSIAQIDNTERTHWGGMVYRHDILETMTGGNVQFPSGNDTPTTVEPETLVRIMKIMDYLYTQEGALLMNRGLTGEAAANNELYQELGMTEGAYWYDENGDLYVHEKYMHSADYNIEPMSLTGQRLACTMDETANDIAVNKEWTYLDDAEVEEDRVWTQYPTDRVISGGVSLSDEESQQFNAVYTDIADYVNTMVPKFIIGSEELNEQTWADYLAHLEQLGLQDMVAAQQSAYDRYMAR